MGCRNMRGAVFAFCALLIAIPDAAHVRENIAQRWTPRGISSDQYESTPTFTPDGRELFFMQSDPRFQRYRILWSRCKDGAWTSPEAPPFAAPATINEADPFVTMDGKRLYFISTRQNQSKGDEDFDIWYVDRKPDGGWRNARPLPEPVNSNASELLPRATADGRIYFGSDRAGGFGQGDIYVAASDNDGKWRIDNVGAPVNTTAFEYEAEVSRDERTLIVVADRGDRSHLYRFEKRDGNWIEHSRIPARPDVFQVGPLLSPKGDRLLFAQADADSARSGEIYLIDLSADPDTSWPLNCGTE
jgi:Tol biopolymer transport system component